MEFPVQHVLELSCAAQRYNNCYEKENRPIYTDEGKIIGYKHSNKLLMLLTADPTRRMDIDSTYRPATLEVIDQDKKLSEDIRIYYRRLMFTVMSQPENQFLQEIMSLLNKEMMPESKFGFVACLPHTYARDKKRNDIYKIIRECNNEYLDDKDKKVSNLSTVVVDCVKSKNFDAYNVLAIVDNKLVSWFSKNAILDGEITILSAKVKDHNENYISKKYETRLNYVKVKK